MEDHRGDGPGAGDDLRHQPVWKATYRKHSISDNFDDLVNVQSVGAAIQNMLLAALDFGLGTLWICDVFYAYEELLDWLREKSQMVVAVSLGYPNESPAARSRKPFDEVVHWL